MFKRIFGKITKTRLLFRAIGSKRSQEGRKSSRNGEEISRSSKRWQPRGALREPLELLLLVGRFGLSLGEASDD